MQITRHLSHFFYCYILKHIFFRQDPEGIHDYMITFGEKIGKKKWGKMIIKFLFHYQHPSLEQQLWGITFSNPVGLASGFDKDARIYPLMESVGFGFASIGTITLKPYGGNPKPRLYRLPQSQGIVVYYGLKNIGAPAIVALLKQKPRTIPQIISIGRTNCKEVVECVAGIEDYQGCLKTCSVSEVGDAYEINISCPNTFGGEPFTTPEELDLLLESVKKLGIQKPIFLKMPINLSWEQFQKLLDVALRFHVQAVNIGNLNKNRQDPAIKDKIPEHVHGSVSGKPTWELSNDLISRTYAYCGDRLIIIGTGGIFSSDDAYEKIKRGASLVELITGMIYKGPQLIGEINYGLVQRLRRDGYCNITEAIGAHHRSNQK